MLDSHYDPDIFSFLADSGLATASSEYQHDQASSHSAYADQQLETFLVDEDHMIFAESAFELDYNRLMLATPQPTSAKSNKKKRNSPPGVRDSKSKRVKLRDHHHHHHHHHHHSLPTMISPAAPLSVAGAIAEQHDQQSPAHLLQEQQLRQLESQLQPIQVELESPATVIVEDVVASAPSTPGKKRGPKTPGKNWNAAEEQAFEEALAVYSNGSPTALNWKQIADHVRTKTAAQVKTHAKLYFESNGGQLPTIAPQRLTELQATLPPALPPSRPGRKPKALLLQQQHHVQAQQMQFQQHVQQIQQQLAAAAASIRFPPEATDFPSPNSSTTLDGGNSSAGLDTCLTNPAFSPPKKTTSKRAGDVIVLCKVPTDEEEEVDIDYDSDHVSIDADGEDDDDISVSSTTSSSTAGLLRPSTPSLLEENSATSASFPLPPTFPSGVPVLSPSLVQFSANSLMMLTDAQLDWLIDLDLPPRQPLVLPADRVVDLEIRANAEFFEGNSAKTPERYLRIRNFIIKQWTDNPTQYVTKTSVRRNLPSCGDVNAMARVHQFLEVIGAINFNVAPPASCRKQGEAPLSPIAEGILRQQQLRARRLHLTGSGQNQAPSLSQPPVLSSLGATAAGSAMIVADPMPANSS